jgi:hypothetical protein
MATAPVTPPDTTSAASVGNSTGDPVIELIRAYTALTPFNFLMEFRYLGFENWIEKVEGDTAVDILIDEATAKKLLAIYGGSFSLIISMVSASLVNRVFDAANVGTKQTISNYIYDSFYVQKILPIENSSNYRLVCVGAKEYLAHRLAIPASQNTTDGTASVPDGSVDTMPIPSTQYLAYTGKSYKGIIAALIAETALLQAMPIGNTTFDLTGTNQRTYLLKDFRTIKEAIDNVIDDQLGIDVTFDGGVGTRNNVQFMFSPTNALNRGTVNIPINDRSSEIFKPSVELAQNDVTNNLWAVGNAAAGNILLSHKAVSGGVLLQSVDTTRSDITTPQFLLDYTVGSLQRSGMTVRTLALKTGLTQQFFLAYVGNYFYFRTPDHMDLDLDKTWWYITQRTINTEDKIIEFDCVEYIMDNNGDGIPDRDQ